MLSNWNLNINFELKKMDQESGGLNKLCNSSTTDTCYQWPALPNNKKDKTECQVQERRKEKLCQDGCSVSLSRS